MYDVSSQVKVIKEAIAQKRRVVAESGSGDLLQKIDKLSKDGDIQGLMKLAEIEGGKLVAKYGREAQDRITKHKEIIKDIKDGHNQQNNK